MTGSAILIIRQFSKRPISFHRSFVPITGGVSAALMLSQALYWSDRTDDDGWFYKTSKDWEVETGLGRREQDTARKQLKNTGFWEEKLRGVPATTYYRIDLEKLALSLAESAKLDWQKAPSKMRQKRQTTLYNSESTTESTIVASTEATPKIPFPESNALQLSPEVPKEKGAYQQCVDFWLKTLHPGWTFGGAQGKAMQSIVKKFRAKVPEEIVHVDNWIAIKFQDMCQRMDSWYKEQDLQVIDSKFNTIITQIQTGGGTKNDYYSKNSASRAFSEFSPDNL